MPKKSTVIIGLGNPIMTDDAIGIVIAGFVHEKILDKSDVEFVEASVGGLELIEFICERKKVIIIDAIQTKNGQMGDLYTVDTESLRMDNIPSMSHQVGLIEGLELGKRLGMKLPEYLKIYAIEVEDVYTFGTKLTEKVEKQVPTIVNEIYAQEFGQCQGPR